MLAFLRDRASDRKLRLFVCACCRRIWHLLPAAARSAVEVAERFADGQATAEDLRDAAADCAAAQAHPGSPAAREAAFWAATLHADVVKFDLNVGIFGHSVHEHAPWLAAQAVAEATPAAWWALFKRSKARRAEEQAQCRLLRDVIGNPFWQGKGDPAWLAWNDGIVVRLARGIYSDRAFDRLPILADALEEAGCADEVLLGHCRSGDEHVPGCWLVDAILGQE
jgi:hypothetical protein